jgi:hypothetical protein
LGRLIEKPIDAPPNAMIEPNFVFKAFRLSLLEFRLKAVKSGQPLQTDRSMMEAEKNTKSTASS